MKKVTTLIVSLFVVFSFTTLAFAGLAMNITRGPLVSIDPVNNQIVVTDDKTGTNKTFSVTAAMLQGLQKGRVVLVTVNPGTNVAKAVRYPARKGY